MILSACQLELRTLLRSPLRLITLALVLGTGLFVLLQGQIDVERWQSSISAGEKAQEESIAEAQGYFAAGEKGPADRSWVDLSESHWQDMYAANRMVRMPAPLAGIAFASAESGATVVRVNRFADPMLAQGNKIENPALASAGGLDLVTVLTLLLPLLILALGIEVGGYERSTGVLPLIRVQSGRDRSWIWARSIAVGIITAIVGLFLSCVAIFLGGADGGSSFILIALVLSYVAVWTVLLGVVASISKNPSHGAVALGATWIVLCVLVPSVGVERLSSLAADDFALDLTVEARDGFVEAFELKEDELFASLFTRFPDLAADVPSPRRSVRRSAIDGVGIVALENRMSARQSRGQDYGNLVSQIGLLTPAVAFTYALEKLADRGPESAWHFRRAVIAAVGERMEKAIVADWRGTPLTKDDFDALVAGTPGRVMPLPVLWVKEFLTLIGWSIGLLLSGMALSRYLGR